MQFLSGYVIYYNRVWCNWSWNYFTDSDFDLTVSRSLTNFRVWFARSSCLAVGWRVGIVQYVTYYDFFVYCIVY